MLQLVGDLWTVPEEDRSFPCYRCVESAHFAIRGKNQRQVTFTCARHLMALIRTQRERERT